MKTKSFIMLIVMSIMLSATSNAQAWLLRRAIDRKLEHKVDSAVDKSDKDEAKAKQQSSQKQSDTTSAQSKGGTKETGRGLFGGKIDIKYDDEYKFTGRIYMQMENYEKKDVRKTDFYTYFNTNTLNAGIETSMTDPKEPDKPVSTVFIYDYDNRCFLMLLGNADSKTEIISTLPSDSTIAAMRKNQKSAPNAQSPDQKMDAGKRPTITKTGNSRIIAGYKCDEYKVVEPDVEG